MPCHLQAVSRSASSPPRKPWSSSAITATGADHDLSERGAHSERLTSLHCTPASARAEPISSGGAQALLLSACHRVGLPFRFASGSKNFAPGLTYNATQIACGGLHV